MNNSFVLAGRIALSLAVFSAAYVLTAGTWGLAYLPIALFGTGVATFAKSRQAKNLGVAAIFGTSVWLPLLVMRDLFGAERRAVIGNLIGNLEAGLLVE